MALINLPGRAGVTINSRGDQMVFGFFPDHGDAPAPNSWRGRLRKEFGATAEISQRHHTFHETRKLNKLKNIATPEVEISARAATARREQRRIAEIEDSVSKIDHERFMTRQKLKPIEYSNGMVEANLRVERRALMRSMKDEQQRIAAMKKYSFREAALETDAIASGLPESVHQEFFEQEVRAKFPDEIAEDEKTAECAETCQTALKAAKAAVEAELAAIGEPILQPAAPEPVKAWA